MKSIYKNYELEPSPDRLVETGRWSTHINIILHKRNYFAQKDYYSNETHKTKEKAENASIIFGQKIIDGIYKDLSAPGI